MDRSSFSVVKWYMDCVTEDGDAVILYCAKLRWRGFHTSYSSLLSTQGRLVESRSSMARFRLTSTEDRLLVELPRLGVSGTWQASAPPFQHIIYENSFGSVLWNCLQPKASVRLRIGARELTGLGYAECLTVTLPPWELPMRQLQWGRFVSPDDSLAWIDWQGPYSTKLAVCNGCLLHDVSVSRSEVAMSDSTLSIEESVPLRAGKLGSTVLPGAPALGKLLPRSLFNIEEQKWLSRGTLRTHERASSGWVIHEVVQWKI